MDRGRLGKTVAAPACCNLSFQAVGFDISTSGGWSTLVRQVERIPLHWSSGRKNKRRPSGWHNVSLQDAPSHTTPLRCNHQHGIQLQHLTRCAFEWENTYNTLILPSSARGRRTERYTGPRGSTGKTSNVCKLQNSSATSATSSKHYSIPFFFSSQKSACERSTSQKDQGRKNIDQRGADVFGQLSSFGE